MASTGGLKRGCLGDATAGPGRWMAEQLLPDVLRCLESSPPRGTQSGSPRVQSSGLIHRLEPGLQHAAQLADQGE